MAHLTQDSLATIYFECTWKSSHATHVERYLAKDISFTRDILPLGVKSRMRGLGPGDSVEMAVDPSEVPPFKPGKVLDMPRSRFTGSPADPEVKTRIGRFYPKHFIENVPGTRPDSATPFRVVAEDKAGFKADLNHPMAGREVTIKATVIDVRPPLKGAGTLTNWSEKIFKGPGMQARLPETPTDFLGNTPFTRENETGDAEFYAKPNMVKYLDSQAISNVQKIYADVLADGMDVLDLMAGHVSHLPDDFVPRSVTGLGLNAEEMVANPALTKHVVHNLNADPRLPFVDGSFDAVVCTVSVEYLTKPFEVFEDVARVLKPGGVFALTFSNHWFEPKVIRIWPELYEFERMGLVSQFFIRSKQFDDIHTSSDRGWSRRKSGADHSEPTESDPIFAVWGRRK